MAEFELLFNIQCFKSRNKDFEIKLDSVDKVWGQIPAFTMRRIVKAKSGSVGLFFATSMRRYSVIPMAAKIFTELINRKSFSFNVRLAHVLV